MPGDTAGASAARGRPFQRLVMQGFAIEPQIEMRGIAVDHRQIVFLTAFVETEPEAEAIRERDFLLHRFRGVDGCRLLVFHHVARQKVAAVGGRVKQDVVRPSLDAAVERRLQGFVGRVVVVEGEVVAEDDDAFTGSLQDVEQGGQGVDILAVHLDQFQGNAACCAHIFVNSLDQRGFAHAARAPEQHVIGGKTIGKTQRIFVQDVAHMVNAANELQRNAVRTRDRLQEGVDRRPDETIGRIPVVYGGCRAGEPFHGNVQSTQFGKKQGGRLFSNHGVSSACLVFKTMFSARPSMAFPAHKG